MGDLRRWQTTLIEIAAAASGLELVLPGKTRSTRDHLRAGTGELILQALESGATNVIIGIGGSATNDGGAGMVRRWGQRYATPTAMKLVLAAVV
ncbi:glycerate kinase [Shigella flexneri]